LAQVIYTAKQSYY